jgi:hypothetical protein
LLTNIKWNADQTDPPVGGRGLKLFMIQEIRENQRCLNQRYQRSNPKLNDIGLLTPYSQKPTPKQIPPQIHKPPFHFSFQ